MIYDTIGRLINSEIDDYEFIMFIRPDWYLKKYFDEVFRPDPERVLYAHLDAGYKLVENPTGFIDGGGRRRDIPHVCHCTLTVLKNIIDGCWKIEFGIGMTPCRLATSSKNSVWILYRYRSLVLQ